MKMQSLYSKCYNNIQMLSKRERQDSYAFIPTMDNGAPPKK